MSRTVRTEVTFERESISLSVNGSALDLCPICGQMCGQTPPPPQGSRQDFVLKRGRQTEITTNEFQLQVSPRKNQLKENQNEEISCSGVFGAAVAIGQRMQSSATKLGVNQKWRFQRGQPSPR
jgi:hypothetical protein